MKYTNEITKQITELCESGQTAAEISKTLVAAGHDTTERSVIAKLSHLGVYKKKGYLTKRGEIPIKKEEYIAKLSELLGVEEDQLESLAKANKSILALICAKLSPVKETTP